MTRALAASGALGSVWDDEDTLEGAVRDGHLFPVPAGDGWSGTLYVDEALHLRLGGAGVLPEVVAAVRAAVAQILETHPVPEIHQDLPTSVDERGRPTGPVRVAVIRQDGAVWLTRILARNPEPPRPMMWRVGAAPAWVGR